MKEIDLSAALLNVWRQQKRYNEQIKAVQTEQQDWLSVYLLGLVGQVNEVLREAGWRRNHAVRTREVVKENVGEELVDMTKFLLCLWQHYGFTAEEMLNLVYAKGVKLESELAAEFFPVQHSRIIVSDLDGTLADFRGGFEAWWGKPDLVRTLNVDLDNGVPFSEYEAGKLLFESSGGYRELPSYPDGITMVWNEQQAGAGLLITTARPYSKFRRIYYDTKDWLTRHHLNADNIVFGRDERVIELLKLARRGNQVVLLEDDPTLALRAASVGIPVMLRIQPYNSNVRHEKIHRYESFPDAVPWEELYSVLEEV